MRVGMGVIFQNPGKALSDHQVYQEDLKLAEMAEPLGFDSVWSVEHHFTDYTMCPDPCVFLAYMAGRSKTIDIGSMVVVLPWHDPLRAAEQIAMLDNLSDGRFILGIGRGAGKVEFDGFRLDMGESRERFVEAAEMVLEGLESGFIEYDGSFYKQPKVELRPNPFKSFKGRTYAAAVSPESARIMARLGVGILIIPQKPWDHVKQELAEYRQIFRVVNGVDAPPTIAGGWVFCDPDPDRARQKALEYIGGYWHSVLAHYQFAGDHMQHTKGYEYYAKFRDNLLKAGPDGATEFFLSLQVWGTPEMCYDKIVSIADKAGADGFNGVFSYAGMPHEEAVRNATLFAETVMPELKKLPPVAERLAAAA
ncbi:MAG: LLM class flavin-dependent oxidoreductase [Pseudomonadota bacterium]|nr:LLM class flavin-dependent oxidoreductase [Pseudomonadota bacterium]